MSLISDAVDTVRSRVAGQYQTGKLDTICPSLGSGVVKLDKVNGHHFAGFDENTEGWSTLVNRSGGKTHPKGIEVIILEMESVGEILHIQKLRLA